MVRGLVQGIGYRAFVEEKAGSFQIRGFVRSEGGAVLILAQGEYVRLIPFIAILRSGCLEAEVSGMDVTTLTEEQFEEIMKATEEQEILFRTDEATAERNNPPFFTILPSRATADDEAPVYVTPDLAICPDCEKELKDPHSRRFHHPFISCSKCGPRYSIITSAPYDRSRTVMRDFDMCPTCQKEFLTPGDPHRGEQLISCHECGPTLKFWRYLQDDAENSAAADRPDPSSLNRSNDRLRSDLELLAAADFIRKGGIVALRTVGGFRLLCSPKDDDAVLRLRRMLQREMTPFALLMPSEEMIRQYAFLGETEQTLLESEARPIVILRRKADEDTADAPVFSEHVLRQSPYFAAMLPADAIERLLADELGPLVITSCCQTGTTIPLTDQQVMNFFDAIVEKEPEMASDLAVLTHGMRILTPLPDSLVRVVCGRTQILRRARGYVPLPIDMLPMKESGKSVLALGGRVKSAFAFGEKDRCYLFSSFGRCEQPETDFAQLSEKKRMASVFRFAPQTVVTEILPPDVMESKEVQKARRDGLQVISVQHQHAHIASVMAEHRLMGSVIGVCYDGNSGYGMDGTIWGSEIIRCKGGHMESLARLLPVLLPDTVNDFTSCESSLYGYLYHLLQSDSWYDETLKGEKREIAKALRSLKYLDASRYSLAARSVGSHSSRLKSSSMAGFFEAAAFLLHICDPGTDPEEAVMELEFAAESTDCTYPMELPVILDANGCYVGDVRRLLAQMIFAAAGGLPRREIVRGFLCAIADYTVNLYELLRHGTELLVLSGGIFRNRFLLEQIIALCDRRNIRVYINEKVSPGDEGLPLGQLYLANYLQEYVSGEAP